MAVAAAAMAVATVEATAVRPAVGMAAGMALRAGTAVATVAHPAGTVAAMAAATAHPPRVAMAARRVRAGTALQTLTLLRAMGSLLLRVATRRRVWPPKNPDCVPLPALCTSPSALLGTCLGMKGSESKIDSILKLN